MVGRADHPGENIAEAVRWTESEGFVGLGHLGSGRHSEAHSVSPDGSVIVGYSKADGILTHAVKWTEADGIVDLGDLPGGYAKSWAWDVSNNGEVIVGYGNSSQLLGDEAVIWTAEGVPERVVDVLSRLGVDTGEWFLESAIAVSADGTVIAGRGINPMGDQEGWIAVIPAPATLWPAGLVLVMSSCRRRCRRDSEGVN